MVIKFGGWFMVLAIQNLDPAIQSSLGVSRSPHGPLAPVTVIQLASKNPVALALCHADAKRLRRCRTLLRRGAVQSFSGAWKETWCTDT